MTTKTTLQAENEALRAENERLKNELLKYRLFDKSYTSVAITGAIILDKDMEDWVAENNLLVSYRHGAWHLMQGPVFLSGGFPTPEAALHYVKDSGRIP